MYVNVCVRASGGPSDGTTMAEEQRGETPPQDTDRGGDRRDTEEGDRERKAKKGSTPGVNPNLPLIHLPLPACVTASTLSAPRHHITPLLSSRCFCSHTFHFLSPRLLICSPAPPPCCLSWFIIPAASQASISFLMFDFLATVTRSPRGEVTAAIPPLHAWDYILRPPSHPTPMQVIP